MLPIITSSLHKAVQLQETGRTYKSTSAKEMTGRQWPSPEISHLKVYNYQNFTEEIPQDSDHLQKFHIWKYYLSFTVQGNKYMICMQKKSYSSTNSNAKITELYWTKLIEKKLLVIPDLLESSMSKAQELHIFHLEQKNKSKRTREMAQIYPLSAWQLQLNFT